MHLGAFRKFSLWCVHRYESVTGRFLEVLSRIFNFLLIFFRFSVILIRCYCLALLWLYSLACVTGISCFCRIIRLLRSLRIDRLFSIWRLSILFNVFCWFFLHFGFGLGFFLSLDLRCLLFWSFGLFSLLFRNNARINIFRVSDKSTWHIGDDHGC